MPRVVSVVIESYLNITIRVAKAQAEAAIAVIRGQLTSLNMSSTGLNTSSSVASVERLTGSLRSAGYALSATFTAPLLLAGRSLIDFSLQNQTAMADLKKVYGANPLANYSKDIDALGRNFKALSNEFGVNQTEVIGIGAAWAQAGVQGAALAESVRNTLKTMIIGDLDSKSATQALISIQGQYRLSTADLTKVLADLNVVENSTAISMEGLITGFQRAAGAAANGGVTYRELAALLASITPYAGTAAQAGNSLKTIISNLEAPSTQASQAIKLLGINMSDTGWKSATATDKLKIVAKAFEGLSDAQKNVEARALSGAFQVSRFDVLLRDIGLSLNKATEGQSRYGLAMQATIDPAKNAQIAQRELEIVLDSNPRKLQVLTSMMKNDLADVLVKLLPLILNLVGAVTSLVNWFSNLNPNVQKMVGIFLLVMAALGPVLLYLSALRDVVRFGGDALFFFLSPLKLIPLALDLILAPARGVIAVIGFLGGLFSSSGKSAEAGSVAVGRSMSAMAEEIAAATATIVSQLELIISLLAEGLPGAGARARTVHAASMADIAAETEAGMTATGAAVVTGSEVVLTAMTVLGGTMVERWAGTLGFIYDETVVGMVSILGAIESGMAGVLAETETGLVLWNAEWAAAQLRNAEAVQAGFFPVIASTRAGMLAVEGEVAAGATATRVGLLSRLAGIPGAILGFFLAIPGRILGLFMGLPGLIARAISGILPALGAVGGAILDALTGPIGIAIGAVILTFALFHKQIAEGWNAVLDWFQRGASGIAQFFSPIVGIFQNAVTAILNAFYALPQGVQNAMISVVNIVESAAKAVYNLFSYLNPWAHHSPSLVENVTTGIDEIKRQFGSLLDIENPIDKAYSDIKRFGSEVASLVGRAQTIKINTDVADIRKAGGGAGAVTAYLTETSDLTALTLKQGALNDAMTNQQRIVDRLDAQVKEYNQDLAVQNAILSQLQNTQQGAQDAMGKAQTDLQTYQSYGITGQKAMSDAIFESQQREKDLQLQMMKIEDVTGPMQDVQSRMQALQGSMDALRGTSKALREAGASQDITGVYDAQTAAMQQQFDTTKAQVSQYDALQKQLADVQRQTQELQLQDSLTYDPLTRQINDVANAMQEMPFDYIIKGVTDSKARLVEYTDQYNAATAAVKAQQDVIRGITAQRDALQSRYDTENAKLDVLKKAYQDVGNAISDINTELQKMTQSAQAINQAAAAAAAAKKAKSESNLQKNFGAAAGGNFPSALGTGDLGGGTAGDIAGIDKLTGDSIKNLQDRLKGLNPFGAIKDKWNEFKGWWGSNVTPGLKEFSDELFGGGGQGQGKAVAVFDNIGKGADAAIKFISPLGRGLKNLFELFKPDFIKWWHDLRDAFNQVGNDIGPKLLPLFQALLRLFQALWPAIKIVAEVIGLVLIAALKIAADIFVNVFGTAIHTIIAVIGDIIQVLTGLIDFVTGILTGNWSLAWKGIQEIFKGVLDAIYHILEGAVKLLYGVIKGFVTGIVGYFTWLYETLYHSAGAGFGRILSAFQSAWSSTLHWLGGLISSALHAIGDLGTAFWNWARSAFGKIGSGFSDGWNGLNGLNGWLAGLGSRIMQSIGNLSRLLYDIGLSILQGLWDGMKQKWNDVAGWVGGLGDKIKGLKGPLPKDKVLLTEEGTAIMQGLHNSMVDKWGDIAKWTSGIGKDIVSSLHAGATSVSFPASVPLPGSVGGLITTPSATVPYTGAPPPAPAPAITYHDEDRSVTVKIEKVEFPNITSSADAQELLDNLEALANGS